MEPDLTDGWQSQANRDQQQIHFDRLQQALDAGGLGLWEIDIDTMMLHRTAPVFNITGPSMIGMHLPLPAFIQMVSPEFRPAVSSAIDRAMKHGEPANERFSLLRPDRSLRWYQAQLYPVLSTTGDVLRLTAISRDITDIRRAEAERESLLRDMATARQAAEHSVRQRDAFITSTVHDLRTPLTSIRGRVQLLQRRLARSAIPGNDRGWLDEGLSQVIAAAGQMTDLLVDLQDVVFLQLGRPLELHPAQVEFIAFTRGIVDEFEILAPDHRFIFTTNRETLPIELDPVRMRRVFSNVLQNAVKYSPPDTDITCRIDAGNDSVTVAIEDRGIGIPAEEHERIFKRYERGSNVASSQEGSGIGLAGARQIVRQHGGELSVESTLGTGSIFRLRLPYRQPVTPPGKLEPEHGRPEQTRENGTA